MGPRGLVTNLTIYLDSIISKKFKMISIFYLFVYVSFIYIGTTGTTSVAFSAGKVLFNTSTVEFEFVSLIVVIGRSAFVGVCACIEVVRLPAPNIAVAIAMVTMNRLEIRIIY